MECKEGEITQSSSHIDPLHIRSEHPYERPRHHFGNQIVRVKHRLSLPEIFSVYIFLSCSLDSLPDEFPLCCQKDKKGLLGLSQIRTDVCYVLLLQVLQEPVLFPPIYISLAKVFFTFLLF